MIFEVGMDKNTKKSKRRKKQNIQDFEIEQDENFRFIVGYTSGGFPYVLFRTLNDASFFTLNCAVSV